MDSRMLGRRAFLRLAAAGTMGAALAACQPKIVEVTKIVTEQQVVKETVVVAGTPQVVEKVVEKEVTKVVMQTVAAPQVPVVKWVKGTNPWYYEMYFTKLKDTFNALHDKVKIEYVEGSEAGPAMFPKLVAAGQDADVVNLHSQAAVPYARDKSILQLDDMYARDLPGIESKVYPHVMDNVRWNKRIHGTVWGYLPFMPVFNADLYNAAGVPLPTETWQKDEKQWNWDTMLDGLLKLTKFDAKGAPTQFGTKLRTDFYGTWCWFWGTGAQIFNKELTQVTYNTPEGVQAMQFVQDLMWEYHVAARPDEVKTWGHALTTGAIGLEWQFSGGNNLKGLVKFFFDAVPVPYGPKGRQTLARGNATVINAKSKVKDAAWEVIKWSAFSKEGQLLAVETSQSVPATMDLEAEFIKLWVPPTHPEYVLDGCRTGIPDPPMAVWNSHLGKIWNEEMNPCWADTRRNVKEALDAAASRQNEALKEEYKV
jgi:ABC-type glycerol-3-phosphate transport system substrate-binding protein